MLLAIAMGCAFASALLLCWALAAPLNAVRAEFEADGVRRVPLWKAAVVSLARLHRASWLVLRQRLTQKLRYANYPLGLTNGAEFMALAELVGLLSGGGLLLLLALTGKLSPGGLVFIVVVVSFAVTLCFSWLGNLVQRRRTAIARQYPYFLDLAVMSMEAGASFMEVIDAYCADNVNGVLAEELGWVGKEMQMGKTLSEALSGLSQRLSSDDIRQSINAIIQGQRMGTPLGQLLREQADGLRFRRSQIAERAAEEIKVKITGPVILMMLSIFILILGPAVISVLESGIF